MNKQEKLCLIATVGLPVAVALLAGVSLSVEWLVWLTDLQSPMRSTSLWDRGFQGFGFMWVAFIAIAALAVIHRAFYCEYVISYLHVSSIKCANYHDVCLLIEHMNSKLNPRPRYTTTEMFVMVDDVQYTGTVRTIFDVCCACAVLCGIAAIIFHRVYMACFAAFIYIVAPLWLCALMKW